MGAFARLREVKRGTSEDDLFAEVEKCLEHVPNVQLFRTATSKRHQIDTEADLQRCVAEQLIEHDVAIGIALQLDHHTGAVAVRLVPDLGDAFDTLFRTNSPMRSCMRALFTWNGTSVMMIAGRSFLTSSTWVRDRITIEPRPVA